MTWTQFIGSEFLIIGLAILLFWLAEKFIK